MEGPYIKLDTEHGREYDEAPTEIEKIKTLIGRIAENQALKEALGRVMQDEEQIEIISNALNMKGLDWHYLVDLEEGSAGSRAFEDLVNNWKPTDSEKLKSREDHQKEAKNFVEIIDTI